MFKRFKEKYIKNTTLYKAYRIKKFKSFISNSAFGEEILVNRILQKYNTGFYVDVGAYNPKVGSLTHQLYKRGWKGINIDFSEENIKLFNLFRKRDLSIRIAISDKESVKNSYIFDPSSGTNTLEKDYAEGWSKNFGKNYKVKKIECRTLTSILNQHNVKKDFEFLNVDVESHDLNVLKGLNLDIYKPKLITCEIIVNQRNLWDNENMYFSSLQEVMNSEITKYLQKKKI